MSSIKTNILNAIRLVFKNRWAENLLAALTNGKTPDALISRVPANYYQYNAGSFREVTRNGFKFRLDLSEYMQWLLFYGIKAEPRDSLFNLLKSEMTVYDIGANIGETSLVFSRRCSLVYAFEPDPETNRRLRDHLSINMVENVITFELAAGNSNASVSLMRTDHNSGGNRITSDSTGSTVEVCRLDDLVMHKNLKFPSLIKIDVEGYELQVLEGAIDIITKSRPIIFSEVNDQLLKQNNGSARSLIDFLELHGYVVSNAYDHSRIDVNSILPAHFDIIARP